MDVRVKKLRRSCFGMEGITENVEQSMNAKMMYNGQKKDQVDNKKGIGI